MIEMQQILAYLGFNPGNIDGRYGPTTGRAIAAYQREVGLPIDGHPSPGILFALLRSAELALRPQEKFPLVAPLTSISGVPFATVSAVPARVAVPPQLLIVPAVPPVPIAPLAPIGAVSGGGRLYFSAGGTTTAFPGNGLGRFDGWTEPTCLRSARTGGGFEQRAGSRAAGHRAGSRVAGHRAGSRAAGHRRIAAAKTCTFC